MTRMRPETACLHARRRSAVANATPLRLESLQLLFRSGSHFRRGVLLNDVLEETLRPFYQLLLLRRI